MITIKESGLVFNFPDGDCFLIEQDDVAKKPNVKVCECVARVQGKDLYAFIEAKSSAPREKNFDRSKICYGGKPIDASWTMQTDFDIFVNDICQKFEDSFSAYYALSAGCHGAEAKRHIPSRCKGFNNTNVRFMLIINGFKEEWCCPLNDALKKRFRHFLNAWNIPDFSVKTLNQTGARAAGIDITTTE
ncbi:MAG TPA: hypothetical protein DC009_04620 [Porphyromonadaceae bacterium]|nr:hypothetical protein [Porphyromonadaceae bacterium]